MEIALYHDSFGYYANHTNRTGKQGDFFTSVNVGSSFGEILAHRIHAFWSEIGKPSDFTIFEMGGNDGQLAEDIITQFTHIETTATIQYLLIEPLPARRKVQQERFSNLHTASVQVLPSTEGITARPGIFLSNELFDAFPVDQLRWNGNRWEQLHVKSDKKSFIPHWQAVEDKNSDPNHKELLEFISKLPTSYQTGYTTEFRAGLHKFFQTVQSLLTKGMTLSIDYGFPRSHYYNPHRNQGTLQTYYQHKRSDDPFISPGNQDITAHVDFTQLAEAQMKNGFEVFDFSSQQRYLTLHGKQWLAKIEEKFSPDFMPKIRQFQTLTMPDMMGNKFHILEMIKGVQLRSKPTTSEPLEVLEL